MTERDDRRKRLSGWCAGERVGNLGSATQLAVDIIAELEASKADRQELSDLGLLLIGVAGTLGRASDCGVKGAAAMLGLVRDAACSIQRGRE